MDVVSMRACACTIVVALLLVTGSTLIFPIQGLQVPQGISSYGTIKHAVQSMKKGYWFWSIQDLDNVTELAEKIGATDDVLLYAPNLTIINQFKALGYRVWVDGFQWWDEYQDTSLVYYTENLPTDMLGGETYAEVAPRIKNEGGTVAVCLFEWWHPDYNSTQYWSLWDIYTPMWYPFLNQCLDFYPCWECAEHGHFPQDYEGWLKDMRSKSTKSMYVWIQVFGGGVLNWTFPSHDQLERLLEFVQSSDADGIMLFLPQRFSHEAETITDDLLSHPEVHNLIETYPYP